MNYAGMKSRTARRLILPLLFVLCQVAQAAAQTWDGTWTLVLLNGKYVTVPMGKKSPSITFKKGKSTFGAFLGVNTMSGTYQIKGSTIKIKTGAQTLMGSSKELMELENGYRKALGTVTTFRQTKKMIEFLNGNKPVLRFVRLASFAS
jgi:heat shock protein HslJ